MAEHFETILRKELSDFLSGPHPAELIYAESCNSTNDLVLEKTRDPDAPPIIIAFCNHQKHGRGRMAHQWVNIAGNDIALSLAFRSSYFRFRASTRYPLASAVIVARAINEVCGIATELKWPNDVMFNGKKLAGILILNFRQYLTTGIGLNVNSRIEDFPDELKSTATTIREILGREIPREKLIRQLVKSFLEFFLRSGEDEPELIEEWVRRSRYVGKTIKVKFADTVRSLVVRDVDRATGELICEDDGSVIKINAMDLIEY